MKLVHIGFGKTATTTLQSIIFQDLCKEINIPYLDLEEFYNISKNNNLKYSPLEKCNYKPLPNKFILSDESLIGLNWHVFQIKKAFEINKYFFDKDCDILITIRKPSDFFNSVYIQTVHNFNIVKEEDFFIYKETKDPSDENLKQYNLFDFSFQSFIDLYKSYYPKVHVVKYEDIKNLDFVEKIFSIKKDFKENLVQKFNKHKVNKSFSKFSIKIFFFLNNFFNLGSFERLVENKIVLNPKNLYSRIKNKIFAQFLIRRKLHNFDNIDFFYSKYKINYKNLPINIVDLDNEYKKILT
jgi:hypothetical protein